MERRHAGRRRATGSSDATTYTRSVELLERSELLDTLTGQIEAAADGTGCVVVLEGEAGVGKTSVLRAVVGRIGGRVLWGGCDALATPRPLGPLRDMAARGADRVAERLAADAPVHDVFDAFMADIATPSVAVMEDLHWADEATLDFLRFAGRRIHGTPSTLFVSIRDDEVGSDHPLTTVLGDLATSGLVRHRLAPLSPSAVEQLAAASGVDAAGLYQATGGNPFFVTEVLAQPAATVPLNVRDAVLGRIGRLDAAARDVVELVASEPGGLTRRLLRRLAIDDRAVDEAVRSRVLVDDGIALRPRHEIARMAIEESLSRDRAADLHRRLLDAMADDPDADPARLAHHAAVLDDADAQLHWSRAAAESALRASANREAVAHFARAAVHVDLLPPAEGAAMLAAYAQTLTMVDQVGTALPVWQRVVERSEATGDEIGAWVARSRLAQGLWMVGRSDDATALIDRVTTALEGTAADDGRVGVAFAIGGYLSMLARRCREAVNLSRRAIEIAERHGNRAALVNALNALGSARIVGFEDMGGVEDLERSRMIAAEEGIRQNVANAYSNIGSASGEVRRYDVALPALEAGLAYATAQELELSRHYVLAWLSRIRFEQGRWDEADALATDAIGGEQASPISPMVALVVRGRIRARRGKEDAQGPLAAGWQIAHSAGDLQRTWPAIAGMAESAWLEGRHSERILEDLAATLDVARRHRIAWAIGECGFWLQRLTKQPVDPAGAAAPFAASLRGDHRIAAEAWTAIGCPYEAAWALADLDDEASLREALRRFMTLGADPLAARVRRRLRELGATGIPAGPRRSTANSPSGLTVREREVLDLLRTGLTDREIADRLVLSPRTVGHHVSAILAKLGVRGRAEAIVAASQGIGEDG